MAKDTRVILDGRSALRYRNERYTPGMEDALAKVLSPSEVERLVGENLLNGEGWEGLASETEPNAAPRLSAAEARRQRMTPRTPVETKEGASEESEQLPYASLLIPKLFADEPAVRAASDEDLLAVEGIGPARLAEIREYFAE